MVPGTHRASKVALEDVINSMPDNVITNILDLLPIQHAVRTSILSRNWRFKWTMLTQLVFDEKFSKYLLKLGGENWYDGKNISRLLFHLKGPITKFVLYIPNDKVLDVEDINHWVMFLSRNGIKEFTLESMNVTPLKLSTHLFSCRELKSLKLWNCSFHSAPTFCAFPNLLNLQLNRVTFESGNCGEIITQCPLLEILKINCHDPTGNLKLVEIAKLKNLYSLILPLRKLDNTAITKSLIFDLGSCLPKLQMLFLDFRNCEFLGDAGARMWNCTSFPNLKTLTLHPIDFSSGIMLLFAFEMIWCSPKLQTLWISAKNRDGVTPPAFSPSELNYIMQGQLQLRNVLFRDFQSSGNEIWLIKTLLQCSPFLKKIEIYTKSSEVFGGDNGKLMFATKLLKLHRASPAKVEIYWP